MPRRNYPDRIRAKRTSTGRLTAEERRRYQTLPGGRFPVPDKDHARSAIPRAVHDSDLTKEERLRVLRQAYRVLGKPLPKKYGGRSA